MKYLIDWPYERSKMRQKALVWIAGHLPREIVMWCYIRVVAYATTHEYAVTNVNDVSALDALKSWEEGATEPGPRSFEVKS